MIQLPLPLASVYADTRRIIAREHVEALADAEPSVLRSLADPATDLDVQEALAVMDPGDALTLCPHGCGEAVYPRRQAHHLAEDCEAVDRDPFGTEADPAGEVRAR